MNPRLVRPFVLAALLVGAASGAAASDPAAAAPDTAAAPQRGWLGRTLQRYFGNEAQTGEALAGRSLEMVDRYAEHAGKTIEVVIVSQVDRFRSEGAIAAGGGAAMLRTVTSPLRSETRDGTIRRYLLFAAGEPVDPFRFADTERLLRALDYIEDVRILLIPLQGEVETVAVVVETRDRWPFGVTGTVKDVGWYEAGVFSSNLGGAGVRFENELLVREHFRPEVGYRGVLRLPNLTGTFVEGALEYEDSYRRLQRSASLERGVVHPAIRGVGGVSWRRVRERDRGPDPDDREEGDAWTGWAAPLRRRPPSGSTARPLLVPAVRFNRTTFLDRPTVGRDTLREFHNAQNYLVGVTFRNLKYYRTSFLFGMGETENLPSGVVAKLSGGYQDGEFHDRTQFWAENVLVRARSRGDVLSLRAAGGGFLRDGVFEDGRLVLGGTYITSLLTHDRWRYRFVFRLYYHGTIDASGTRALELGDEEGLRGMDDNRLFGNRRLVATLEHRAFTPWSVLGFRVMLLGFLDAGTIRPEDGPLLGGKFYVSAGAGVRIRNPDLVLPAVQMRVAFLNAIDDKGVLVGFKVGNVGLPDIEVPSARPGGFTFR